MLVVKEPHKMRLESYKGVWRGHKMKSVGSIFQLKKNDAVINIRLEKA